MERDHDRGILASLALVHRDRVSEPQLVELGQLVFRVIVLESDADAAALGVDRRDTSDLAVENQLVVVVAQLDHAVAHAERPVTGANFVAGRIQQRLQLMVERMSAERPAIHRREHLDFARVAQFEAIAEEAMLHQLLDGRDDVFRRAALEEKEIALGIVGGLGHLAAVQPMGVGDDQARARLAIDLAELDHRHQPRGDHVLEHAARTDRGQLVAVANQQQRAIGRQRREQARREFEVHHRGLVDNQPRRA